MNLKRRPFLLHGFIIALEGFKMAKLIQANLLNSVTGAYDQTKTTIAGRIFAKTVNSESCLGPPLSNVIDVFTDTAGVVTPAGPMSLTSNGRLFVVNAIAAGVGQIALYNFDLTGQSAPSYVGRVLYNMPNTAATTHTIRGLTVDDTAGTSNWKIFIATTGSVAINGGLFMINSMALSDFVPVGPATIPLATGSGQKAVYMLQGSAVMGSLTTTTAAVGIILDTANTKVYLHNGVSATHQYHVFDYSTTPNNPGATVTITIATPGVVTHNAHGYAANDPIVLSTTGALPTGLTAGTVYFVRNPTANTYELSATTGGALIATSGAQSGTHTARRAYGQTSSLTYFATGNLPALTGTLLLTNSEEYYTPDTGTNAGTVCATFATTTNAYEGKLSEITNGATSWASLRTVNLLGGPLDIISPTAQYFHIGQQLKDIVYVTANAQFVAKPFTNSVITAVFGQYVNAVLEANPMVTQYFGLNTVTGIERQTGWLLAASSTASQRVISYVDYRSDTLWDYSSIISPVLTLNNGVLKDIRTIEAAFDLTGTISFQYRLSGFGSASGGWIDLSTAQDLETLGITGSQIQIKLLFDITNQNLPTPAQVIDVFLDAVIPGENSDRWEVSQAQTASGTPTRTAFRLKTAYTSSVPTLYYRGYDLSNALLVNHNTVTNAANFQYSTDGGTTWLPLGTIPNTVGTLIRYTWSSPPGVDIRPSIRES